MSTRGACGVCPANYCFSYESDGTTQLCFCGHPATTHPFLPSLPPRGPCPLCRCPGFQYTTVEAARPGSTLCIRTTCEHAYITHARLPEAAATAAEAPLSSAPPARAAVTPTSSLASVTSVPPPMVPARATPGNIWSIAGSQAAGTADGRRRQQAALHGRAWGPGSGSQYPRGTHRAFPSSTQQGKQRETAGPTVLKFAFYPFSLTWPGNEDISEEDADLFPAREFRIVGNGEELFKKFAIYNLLFTFTVPADRETSNSPRSFYQELDDCIQAWAKDACIQFYPHTPAPSPTHHAVQSDSWNMHKFSQVEWQLLSVGNKERALGSGRRITASLITWTQFTLAQFSKVAKPVVSPIDGDECYVLVPKHGPLRGILPNDPTNHIHVCLPFHVLATVPGTPFHDVAHVVCHPRCHPSPLVDRQASRARPVAHLTRQATSSTHQTASSTPLFIADDDDQPEVRSLTEEEQETRDMEQAIRQSLETAPPPPNNQGTSNAIAGPSTLFQPSTQAGTRRVRSPSVEAIDRPEPPLQRRRLGTNTVPEDSIAAFANKSIPGFHTWQSVLTTVLDNNPVRFQGPSVHSLVNTLHGRIRAFFGGDPWFPENPVDASTIMAPDGPLGLLTMNTTWIAGESSGEGVGKTVMEELMNTIFADVNIWKKVAQNGQDHVIDVLPQGFPLEQDRRVSLQTYGYACMLYMIYRQMLPKALSTLFACAILSPDGETELLKDKTFLRLIAPAQMEALDQWPSDSEQKEFAIERPSNGLYYLANTFFEKQPVFFSTVSSDTLAAYTNFLYRKVFIGTDACLKDSPEISLFAQTFNSRLNSHSPITFAHTFGTSLRSMMTKMCAMRLQSVPDLLDRLNWVSTLKPELQELERKYKAAFTRYISLPGIVEHPLLPKDQLTELERQLPSDHMLARALMYLMTATGTQQLPAARGTINMVFHPHLENTTDITKKDPAQNPEKWPDFISPVQTHTCFDGADLPLRGLEFLLRQPIPEDNTATDFDLYQYMMYRPITQFAEFGGLL